MIYIKVTKINFHNNKSYYDFQDHWWTKRKDGKDNLLLYDKEYTQGEWVIVEEYDDGSRWIESQICDVCGKL